MMFQRSCLMALCLSFSALLLAAADAKPDPTPDQIQDIIKKFTQKETEFAIAREGYEYRQSSKITEVDPPGGIYQIVEEVTFDERDRRTSHVIHAPATSLQNILMTHEDEQDLRNIMPFVMTNDTLGQYDVKYLKREQVDEIPCYVFSVHPKVLTKDRKRYFDGDIWVDDQDLQIVKTYGRSTGYIGHEDQQFPKFETYREQIDGRYWFPTYTYADDTLNFKDGQSQRIKVVIKYDQYRKFQFKTESTIKYGDVGSGSTTPQQTTPPTAPQTPPKQ